MNNKSRLSGLLPVGIGIVAAASLVWWLAGGSEESPSLRLPGSDRGPDNDPGTNGNAVLAGRLLRGEGQPANLPGAWPGFRGTDRDGISKESAHLSQAWPAGNPRQIWAGDVGEGYAGASVLNGRVYLIDYDREHKQDALRCLSLADGREIWRFAYPVNIKRNHGVT